MYCSVCAHEYSCTCADALIHATSCKLIHLKRRSPNKCQSEAQPLTLTTGIGQVLSGIQNEPTLRIHTNLKDRLMTKLPTVSTFVNDTTDTELLLSLERHIDTCIGTINISRHTTTKSTEPHNKLISKQRLFYSTKRKHCC